MLYDYAMHAKKIFCAANESSLPSSPNAYDHAIMEGQTATQELIDRGEASAITIALVDSNHIIWTQTFGLADPITGKALFLIVLF